MAATASTKMKTMMTTIHRITTPHHTTPHHTTPHHTTPHHTTPHHTTPHHTTPHQNKTKQNTIPVTTMTPEKTRMTSEDDDRSDGDTVRQY